MGELKMARSSGETDVRNESTLKECIRALEELSAALSKVLSIMGELEMWAVRLSSLDYSGDFFSEVRLFEIKLIQTALQWGQGCQKRAAGLLGIKPTTLNSKIKVYGIKVKDLSMPPGEHASREKVVPTLSGRRRNGNSVRKLKNSPGS